LGDSFGDPQCVTPPYITIKAITDLSRIDGNMHVQPGISQEAGGGKLCLDILLDAFMHIDVFAQIDKVSFGFDAGPARQRRGRWRLRQSDRLRSARKEPMWRANPVVSLLKCSSEPK